jgi:protein O-GlcNAc transferase
MRRSVWPRRGAADEAPTWRGRGDSAEGSGTSDAPGASLAVVAALAPPDGDACALLCPDPAFIDAEVVSRLILSAQHLAAGQTDAAAHHARVALWRRPDNNCDALLALGAAAARAGDATAARAVFARAARRWPRCAAALCGLATAGAAAGLPTEAVSAAFTEAARVDPSSADAQVGLASIARDAGRLDDAEARFARAAELRPGDARLHAFLGGIRYEQGKMHDAMASYAAALQIAPGFVEVLNDAGNALRALGRLEDARKCYTGCLACHATAGAAAPPGAIAVAYANLGAVCKLQNRGTEALTCFQQAAALQPDNAEMHAALGGALKDVGHHEGALASFRKAQAIRPSHAARAQMLHSLACVCAWDEFDAELRTVVQEAQQLLAAGQPCAVQPFHAMAYDLDAGFVLQLCRAHAASISAAAAMLGVLPAPRAWPASSCLRVAFVSSDFGQHPLSHLLGSVFGMLDRSRISATLYALSPPDGSVYRQRIEAEAERFVDASALSPAELATRIAADGCQVLVDLNGYTKGSRTEAIALRPAPVQISYMGFPSTTGADFIDWLIADGVVAPPQLQHCYSERLLCMPHSYFCADYAVAFPRATVFADAARPSRADVGLPADAFVFACLNQLYKVGAATFAAWMRILAACPRSVLWLLRFPPQGEARLRAAAAAAGVDPSRLVFTDVADKEAHLARCSLADLVLDTTLCNAHTTAADALWAGVPMLTLPGERFASRVGASILAAHGCADCIAPSVAEYERMAVHLYRDAGALQQLTQRVRRNRDAAPLFDTRRWVANFEEALHAAWRMHVDEDRNTRHVQLSDATATAA